MPYLVGRAAGLRAINIVCAPACMPSLLTWASAAHAGLQALEISVKPMAAHTMAGIARLAQLTMLIADVSVASMDFARCELMHAQQWCRLRFVEV